MNSHVTTGFIVFVIWSTFSTWYYVNYIKDFDPQQLAVEMQGEPVQLEEVLPSGTPEDALDSTVTSNPSTVETLAPVNISKNILFVKNSTQLASSSDLEDFKLMLSQVLADRKVDLIIEGHTCDLGTEKYNQELGRARADFIAGHLQALGIDFGSVDIQSAGETRPEIENISEENRAQNRRVSIIIKSQP